MKFLQEKMTDVLTYQQFRVMTYNILAKMYSDTDLARDSFFRHCPSYALDMDYRKHLLLKEIIGYKADLICLQEVEKSVFETHLKPALDSIGYTGLFRPKASQTAEGCASFVLTKKFRVVKEMVIVLTEHLKSDPSCADIWQEVSKVKTLRGKLDERSSILQVAVLEMIDNPQRVICLANTHLYFHPTACNIRLIHAAVALRYLQNAVHTYKQEGKIVGMVFCGDFNSGPHLGIYQLMTAQFVQSDHADWSSAGNEELLSTLELSQPMNIESACGIPSYTNYILDFQQTLDYIYMDSDQLDVCSTVPLPSHEEVTAHQALPNVVFPSDHIALISELEFKN